MAVAIIASVLQVAAQVLVETVWLFANYYTLIRAVLGTGYLTLLHAALRGR